MKAAFGIRLFKSLLVTTLMFWGVVDSSVAQVTESIIFYLHSDGTTRFLDANAPTEATAQVSSSGVVRRNSYAEIGTWTATPITTSLDLVALGDLHVWIGLKSTAP